MTIGNILFEAKDELDPAKLASSASRTVKTVATLLKIDEKRLTDALLHAINITRGEKIKREYNTNQAFGKATSPFGHPL